MSALHTDRAQIGKLRVQAGPRPDLIAMQLGRADIRPASVPPNAILIVRSLADPLPGRLSPLGHRPGPAWERAVCDRLALAYGRAARPARQAVPMDAEAVVFADEAEFLASLALDLVRNSVRERWWWRGVIGAGRTVQAPTLASVFLDRAASVPAALSLLAARGAAAEVVRGLSPPEARAVLCAVCGAYGVGHVATMLDLQSDRTGSASQLRASARDQSEARPADFAAPSTPGEAATGAGMAKSVPGGTGPEQQPPWAACLAADAVPAALERMQACLLGVALTLHARPGAVRAPGFAAALQRWRTAAEAPQAPPTRRDPPPLAKPIRRPPPPAGDTSHDAAEPASRRAKLRNPMEGAQASAQRIADAGATSAQAARFAQGERKMPPRPPWHQVAKANAAPATPVSSPDMPGAPGLLHALQTPTPSPDAMPDADSPTAEPPALPPQPAMPRAAPTPAPATSAEAESPQPDMPAASAFAEGGAETALSGVLFLINLMIALDLPACFEETWQLGSRLGAWGVLEALARALLPPDTAHASDPLWHALKELGGHTADEFLGSALPDPVDYALPALWQEHRPEAADQPRYWSARSGEIRIWTPAGYISNEFLAAPDTSEAAARAMAQHCVGETDLLHADCNQAPLADLAAPHCAFLHPAVRRWLCLVIPFLRLRLARAGIDCDAKLFERPGRLFVTATHVDLVMPHNAVSLPVRRAGLDRNPGWLGDFGRIILFHYE